MGRLYDSRDMAWNIAYWNRLEMQFHASLTDGTYRQNAADLNCILTQASPARQRGADGQWLQDDVRPSRHLTMREAFQRERLKERFKLLRTSRLLSNLKAWEAIFKACPHCHTEASRSKSGTRNVPCEEHDKGYKKARSDVWWAGEHNQEERAARGQIRAEDLSTELHPEISGLETLERIGDVFERKSLVTNPLNKWEAQFQRDRAQDAWTEEDARLYEVEPDYRGWLRMCLENCEMTEREYLDELQRLRQEANELEYTTRAVAGTNTKIRRDTRHNQLSN